jgi:hypothetical protein
VGDGIQEAVGDGIQEAAQPETGDIHASLSVPPAIRPTPVCILSTMAFTDPIAAKGTRSHGAAMCALATGSTLCLLAALAWPLHRARAAADVPRTSDAALQIITTMMHNENTAALHKDHYCYLSKERSERTGGHLWTEKVVETNVGKIRMLLAEDGQPLSPERIARERGRLAEIVADPSAFIKKSQTTKDDEAHARQMLALATRAFLFEDPRPDGSFLRIDYRPNPDYATQSMEERVLHGMSGTMIIDPQAMRLHHIDGHLPVDVSLGFGIIATVRAGSSFSTTRDRLGQPDWKTTQLDTAINGRIIFFKSIAKNEHAEHANFTRIPDDLTIPQAVALVEQP